MSEKITKAQRARLKRLSVGPAYGSGPVESALVRKGLATGSEGGSCLTITSAGRKALSPPSEGEGP